MELLFMTWASIHRLLYWSCRSALHVCFACLPWCKEHLRLQSWRPAAVPFALLYSLRCCVYAGFEMSFISVWFASILYLEPVKVVHLQLPLLLQSIQSVIADGKFSVNAKRFKAIIPNMFSDTHMKVLWLLGKNATNCWAALETAFKKWGSFRVSGSGRAVFLSNCKPRSYCISYCITATGNVYFAYFFFSCFLIVLSFCHIVFVTICMHWSRNCMHAWFGALLPFCRVVART